MINGKWTNPGWARCYGKASYPNVQKASLVAERMSTRDGDLLLAYECPDCRRWHVGHPDRSQTIAHEQAITRATVQKPSRPQILAERLAALPTVCAHYDGAIPGERREAAASTGTKTVYCSQRCQRNFSSKRRKAKRTEALTE